MQATLDAIMNAVSAQPVNCSLSYVIKMVSRLYKIPRCLTPQQALREQIYRCFRAIREVNMIKLSRLIAFGKFI